MRPLDRLLLLAAVLGLAGCPCSAPRAIDVERVLMIRDVSVVDDPARTATPNGAWTFGRLMRDLAPPGEEEEAAFVKAWLKTWEAAQEVNGFPVAPRSGIKSEIVDLWRRKDAQGEGHVPSYEEWKPKLENAPFRLLAIVFRPDLARVDVVSDRVQRPAEGRFVFGAVDATGDPLRFTMIFEYDLAAADRAELQRWARDWEALGALAFGEGYNAALQNITDRFARRGAAATRPNGSALSQVRTNEFFALSQPWELREFRLVGPAGGRAALVNVSMKQTPDLSLNGSLLLEALINHNETTIKDRKYVVPEAILAGSALVPRNLFWKADGVRSNQARHLLSLGTCNGCHHVETGAKPELVDLEPIGFLHVGNRRAGERANLSIFLAGGTVVDPVSGETRKFAELDDRRGLLEALLSGDFAGFQSIGAQRHFRVH